jgi:hypothetical protein
VLIVLSPTFTPRNLVEGWQVVTIVASMVISIVAYGAFIFNRALQLAAKADRKGIDMSAILRLPPPPEPPPASEPTPP